MTKVSRGTCEIQGCEKPAWATRLCQMHYGRIRRTGSPHPPPVRLCSVAGCGKKHYGRGYCAMHHARLKTTGSLELRVRRRGCEVPGCGEGRYGRGLCRRHYALWSIHGTPEPVRALPPSLPGEGWRPVPGLEGLLSVSNLGRFRTHERKVPCRGGERTLAPRILSTRPNVRHGYLELTVRSSEGKRTYRAHKLVAAAFLGPRPNGLVINHKDGNRVNNRVENLEYVTQAENNRHSFKLNPRNPAHHLPRKRGEANPQAVITEETVRTIRGLRRQGLGPKEISVRLGLHVSTVGNVIYRGYWAHVR